MKKLLTILLLVLSFGAHAQPDVSSFYIQEEDLDTNYVNYLIGSAEARETDSVEFTLEKAIYIAEKLNYGSGVNRGFLAQVGYFKERENVSAQLLARLRYHHYLQEEGKELALIFNETGIGDLYFEKQVLEKAREHYMSALERAKKQRSSKAFSLTIKLARAEKGMANYATSTKLFNEALEYATSKGKEDFQLSLHQDLAEVAHNEGNYKEEVNQYLQVFSLAEKLGREKEKAVAMNNMAYAYNYLGNDLEAEGTYVKVLEKAPADTEPLMRAGALQSLGVLYNNRGQFDFAYSALDQAAKLYKKAGADRAESTVYDFLSLVYLNNDDSYNAMVFNNQAIETATKGDYKEVLKNAYLTRSLIHQSLYEFEEALDAHKKHLAFRDEINEAARAEQNDLSQQKIVMAKLENELELFFVDKEINALEKARILAENDAKAERIKALEKENELAESESKRVQLTARQKLAKAMLEQEQQKSMLQESEIENLNKEKMIQEAELEKQKQDALIKEQENDLLEAQNLNQELEIKQKATENRNLIFLIGGLLLLLAAIIFGFFRIRSKNRKIAEQNAIILEDQKIIVAEKKKSDDLLHNILPAEVAAELKATNAAKPQSYSDVSVMFTDFKGFTMIAEQLSPEELVGEIDHCFKAFDNIIGKYRIEKIKTIGDAYMCVGGLPGEYPEHAEEVVRAALEIRDFMGEYGKKRIAEGKPAFEIRIGIHTGPVVAGIVGIKKYAYDIWGDTVNTAARMESSGSPGKVNLSGFTYELVKDKFSFEHRGKIKAKNKGEIDMYFVEPKATVG